MSYIRSFGGWHACGSVRPARPILKGSVLVRKKWRVRAKEKTSRSEKQFRVKNGGWMVRRCRKNAGMTIQHTTRKLNYIGAEEDWHFIIRSVISSLKGGSQGVRSLWFRIASMRWVPNERNSRRGMQGSWCVAFDPIFLPQRRLNVKMLIGT